MMRPETVADRITRAARAARAMPQLREMAQNRGVWTRWPELVQHSLEVYDRAQPRHIPRRPSPEEIDAMDEAFSWLLLVGDRGRRAVVWARACGITWRRLQEIEGLSEPTLRKMYREGLSEIAEGLGAL